jgi:hypothetical protein
LIFNWQATTSFLEDGFTFHHTAGAEETKSFTTMDERMEQTGLWYDLGRALHQEQWSSALSYKLSSMMDKAGEQLEESDFKVVLGGRQWWLNKLAAGTVAAPDQPIKLPWDLRVPSSLQFKGIRDW